jgi:uncharacterized membrane protein YidH (DUF202 family)
METSSRNNDTSWIVNTVAVIALVLFVGALVILAVWQTKTGYTKYSGRKRETDSTWNMLAVAAMCIVVVVYIVASIMRG